MKNENEKRKVTSFNGVNVHRFTVAVNRKNNKLVLESVTNSMGRQVSPKAFSLHIEMLQPTFCTDDGTIQYEQFIFDQEGSFPDRDLIYKKLKATPGLTFTE